MVFAKPYAGIFAYEGIIPSTFCNNVNNDIANSVDKTGETAALGGGITGEIEVLSGGILEFLPGGLLSLLGEMNVTSTGSVNFGGDGSSVTLNMQGSSSINIGADGLLAALNVSGPHGAINMLTGSAIILNGAAVLAATVGSKILLGGTTPTQVFPSINNPGGIARSYLQSFLTGIDTTNTNPIAKNWSINDNGISEFISTGQSIWSIPLKMHDGATLSSITINYYIANTHTAPTGTNRISATLWVTAANGTTISLGTAYASNYTHGIQFFILTPSGYSIISNATYVYNLVIVDEYSATTSLFGNQFNTIQLSFSDITSSVWSQ